jgi:predicted dehydrogenase
MAPLRLGIVGCGRIVERGYLAAIRRSPEVAVVSVADPNPQRARQIARVGGAAAVFADAAEMIAAGGVDALLVTVPADDHFAVASLAADYGLPCLVEKPPAPDFAGAAVLAALVPTPSIGFNRRFLQGLELSPSIPVQGWLELELELRFRRAGWGAHLSHDEALLDAGTHLIDLAAFLTGAAPIAVRNAGVEPERAELELELGRARARIRCATDRPYAERVEVRDRSGRLIAASRLGRISAARGRLRSGEDPLVLSLRRQLQRFVTRARGEVPAQLASAEDGVAAMAVVEAARRSAELGGAEITVETTASADGPSSDAMRRLSAHRREGTA